MVYYQLVKHPAHGWEIKQHGERKDGRVFHLRIQAAEHVHPVWVKDAADSCLALIQNNTKMPMEKRFQEAEKILQHKWQEWDEYIAYFQGPPRRLPPGWMHWPEAFNMQP